MRRYNIAALIIATANVATFLPMRRLAHIERGYHAYGGEILLFIFGFIIAVVVFDYQFHKKKTPTKAGTLEGVVSGQSKRHTDNVSLLHPLPIIQEKKGAI